MKGRRLEMRRMHEVLHVKWVTRPSHGEITRASGTWAATVADCVKRAKAAGPGWPPREGLDDNAVERRPCAQAVPSARARTDPDLAHGHQGAQRWSLARLGRRPLLFLAKPRGTAWSSRRDRIALNGPSMRDVRAAKGARATRAE